MRLRHRTELADQHFDALAAVISMNPQRTSDAGFPFFDHGMPCMVVKQCAIEGESFSAALDPMLIVETLNEVQYTTLLSHLMPYDAAQDDFREWRTTASSGLCNDSHIKRNELRKVL